MKMMGVLRPFLCLRIRLAVSRPSMSGMLTSSRMTANSVRSTHFSASVPEVATTRLASTSSSRLLYTSRFSGKSSTMRICARVIETVHSIRAKVESGDEHRRPPTSMDHPSYFAVHFKGTARGWATAATRCGLRVCSAYDAQLPGVAPDSQRTAAHDLQQLTVLRQVRDECV